LTSDTDGADARRRLSWLDPVLTAELSAFCALACVLTSGPLRWVAGALLVAYLPGRSVRCALRWNPQGIAVEGAIDVALSLSLVVLIGMALNGTGPGIQLWTMLPAIMTVAILASLVDLVGRRGRTTGRRPAGTLRLLRVGAIPIAIFTVMGIGAIVISGRSADTAAKRVKTTELSVVSSSPVTARVTVRNAEHLEETYGLVVSAPGEPTVIDHVRVPAGDTDVVSVPTGGIKAGNRLTASLYLASTHWPFRQAWLTVPQATQPSTNAER
jgi:hypothetical protein